MVANNVPYPATTIDYHANIINHKAEAFYRHHGVSQLEHGLEETHDYDDKALMTTRYCLRYELGCCLQGKNSHPPQVDIRPNDTLYLHNQGTRLRIVFDCRKCRMCLYKA